MTRSKGRRNQTHKRRLGLDAAALRAELVTSAGIRPVQDIHAPALTRPPARPVQDIHAPAVSRPIGYTRERRAHLRQDEAGVPCACDDWTPCLAHAGITGRRRWLWPR
jgi:hypothetical protein